MLPLPPGGLRVRRGGIAIALYGPHDHAVAVFERVGHTCILSAHVAHRSTLLTLAAWTGNGALRS
jgi:hypothetical protein